jgi:hypothetical protein
LFNITWRTTTLLTIAAATSMGLSGTGAAGAATASTPPGDNGTVKVHQTSTAASDPRNEPHVCAFYLVGFNFDPTQRVTWRIVGWAPTGDRKTAALSGTLTLDASGHGRTADLNLPDGHYKLYWNFNGEHGSAKHKVFWVKCKKPSPKPSHTASHSPKPTASPTESPSATPSPTVSGGAAPPSTSPPPSATAPPENRAGNLPVTGFAGRLLAAIGAALVLGGAGVTMAARRRRGRHATGAE